VRLTKKYLISGKQIAMRKLISGINLTLDGCCDHTKGNGNDEVHEYFVQQMLDVGQKPLHHRISIISRA